jgi:hypothetical protein
MARDPFAPPPPPDDSPKILEQLCKVEWVDGPDAKLRMRFRKEGNGFYERSRTGSGKPNVNEGFIFKFDRDGLRMKFQRNPLWGTFKLVMKDGTPDGRIGAKILSLEKDPYVTLVEDDRSAELVLKSDTGAALPG